MSRNLRYFCLCAASWRIHHKLLTTCCEQYVNESKISEGDFSFVLFPNERNLIQVSKEIRNKKTFLNPFCNEHFYHVWQLPLKRHSRLYYFGENLDWLEIGSYGNASHTACSKEMRIHDCNVVIKNTCLPPHDVLQAISSLRQTISSLRIVDPFVVRDEVWKNKTARVFKIDPLATNMLIGNNVVLPTHVSKCLGEDLSTCYNLKVLNIINNFLLAVDITDWLGVNTKLTFLDLSFCNISRKKSAKLCQQFRHLSNLQTCYLLGNVLGDAASVLAESIQSWGTSNSLDALILRNCSITARGCTRLIEALSVCLNLYILNLSHNTIGGAFDGLTSESTYPGLTMLNLVGTGLSSGDIKTIGTLIEEKRIPKLEWIFLSYNNLDNLELDTLETLEVLNSIINKVPEVFFWKGNSVQDFDKIQESITRNTKTQIKGCKEHLIIYAKCMLKGSHFEQNVQTA